MWRIAMILLALVTLLGSATIGAADHDHDRVGMEPIVSVVAEEGSDCLSVLLEHDDCLGLTCCMALHCASFAAPAGAALLAQPCSEPMRQAFQDCAIPQLGRVIAPPTAPPKFA